MDKLPPGDSQPEQDAENAVDSSSDSAHSHASEHSDASERTQDAHSFEIRLPNGTVIRAKGWGVALGGLMAVVGVVTLLAARA
ncbi:MAG: hypothetical protein AAFU80_02730 [Pseudomonadota bacterium]